MDNLQLTFLLITVYMHTHTHTHTHTHIIYIGGVFLDKLSKSPQSHGIIGIEAKIVHFADMFNVVSCPVHERN